MKTKNTKKAVIIGGGFGGLYVAKALRNNPDIDITIVDRRNFHLFQPLLYQVATGGLSPGDIASPIRAVLKRGKNIKAIQAEVTSINLDAKKVLLKDGELDYDYLVVAAGARHAYFGNNHWEEFAPGLKTVEDAMEIRRRVFSAFEAAERETDPEKQRAWLNFVIVGGGPTGVELAGALGELAHRTLKGEFRNFKPEKARIILMEGGARVLSTYSEKQSQQTLKDLAKLGVEVIIGARVTDINAEGVHYNLDGKDHSLPAKTVLWAAGVAASPLARMLGEQSGAEIDRAGRIKVQPDLSLPNHPNVFAIGDMASIQNEDGSPVPGVAPAAMQQAAHVAQILKNPQKKRKTFRYFNKGNLAVIGRNAAVADLGWIRFHGFPAWFVWLVIHIMYLIEFDNKLLVMMQWAYCYFTRKRGARLITGHHHTPHLENKEARAT